MLLNSSVLAGKRLEFIEEAQIVIERGIISAVEEGFSSKGKTFKDYLAVPALINAHTHLGDSFAKEAFLGLSVEEAVGKEGKKWSLYREATREEILHGMRNSLQYMLNSGTGTFADFRENGAVGVKILKEALFQTPLKAIILGRDLPIEGCDGLGLNVYQLGQIPANRKGKLIAIHAGENEGELPAALDKNPDIIVHFTRGTPEEVLEAAKRNISVVLCPRANALLSIGIPPVRELLQAGINLCLGTDNVALNSPNLFREMEFLSKISCLKDGIPPVEILKMVTVNPAKALKLNSGAIEKGSRADLLLIDKTSPNLDQSKDLIASLVHRCDSEDIRKVILGGEFVLDKS